MSWQSIDFFQLEPSWFAEEIHKVVPGFFADGQHSIELVHKEIEAEVQKVRAEAKDEGEASYASDLRDHELSLLEKRKTLLGAAALHYMYESLKIKLAEIVRYFDSSHPPNPPYNGKSELLRLKHEFLKRFALDFEAFPGGFWKIEELALARNGLIHSDLGDYFEKIKKPRIIQRNGEFAADRLDELIGDVVDFVSWTVQELQGIRKAHATSKGTRA